MRETRETYPSVDEQPAEATLPGNSTLSARNNEVEEKSPDRAASEDEQYTMPTPERPASNSGANFQLPQDDDREQFNRQSFGGANEPKQKDETK